MDFKRVFFDFNNPDFFIIKSDRFFCYHKGNSCVTIKTKLIDIEFNASPLGVDFAGNYTFGGSDILQSGLDIVGLFDPTDIADGLSAKMSWDQGDYWGAAASAAGALPIVVGDLAKVGKIGKAVDKFGDAIKAADKASDANKASNTADVVTHAGQKVVTKTGQKIGPSGKPMVHTVQHASKKEAKDAARQGGKGTPVKHTKDNKEAAIITMVMVFKEKEKGQKIMAPGYENEVITLIMNIDFI